MTPEEREAQCANCEHPLSEHPPDSPCCPKCSGWVPKLEEIKAHVRLHGSIPGRYSHWLLSELDRVTAEREEWARRRLQSIDDACMAGPGGCHADALESNVTRLTEQRNAALAELREAKREADALEDVNMNIAAQRDDALAQVEKLRGALDRAELWLMERHPDHQQEGLEIIQAALKATEGAGERPR